MSQRVNTQNFSQKDILDLIKNGKLQKASSLSNSVEEISLFSDTPIKNYIASKQAENTENGNSENNSVFDGTDLSNFDFSDFNFNSLFVTSTTYDIKADGSKVEAGTYSANESSATQVDKNKKSNNNDISFDSDSDASGKNIEKLKKDADKLEDMADDSALEKASHIRKIKRQGKKVKSSGNTVKNDQANAGSKQKAEADKAKADGDKEKKQADSIIKRAEAVKNIKAKSGSSNTQPTSASFANTSMASNASRIAAAESQKGNVSPNLSANAGMPANISTPATKASSIPNSTGSSAVQTQNIKSSSGNGQTSITPNATAPAATSGNTTGNSPAAVPGASQIPQSPMASMGNSGSCPQVPNNDGNRDALLKAASAKNSSLSMVQTQELTGLSNIATGEQNKTEGSSLINTGKELLSTGASLLSTGSSLVQSGQGIIAAGTAIEAIGNMVTELANACGSIPIVGSMVQGALNAVANAIKMVGTNLKSNIGPAIVAKGNLLNTQGNTTKNNGTNTLTKGTQLLQEGLQLVDTGNNLVGEATAKIQEVNNFVTSVVGDNGNSSVNNAFTTFSGLASGFLGTKAASQGSKASPGASAGAAQQGQAIKPKLSIA